MVHMAMPPLRPIAHHLTNLPALDQPYPHTHFDNPAPAAPDGLRPIATKWLSWLKWIAGIAGTFGLCTSGIMMACT